MFGAMWRSASPVQQDTPIQRIVEAKVVKARKTISPMCCDECDGEPSDHCWEQYNCLVAFERKFDKPFVGSGK